MDSAHLPNTTSGTDDNAHLQNTTRWTSDDVSVYLHNTTQWTNNDDLNAHLHNTTWVSTDDDSAPFSGREEFLRWLAAQLNGTSYDIDQQVPVDRTHEHAYSARSTALVTLISIATVVGVLLNVVVLCRLAPGAVRKPRLESALHVSTSLGWLLFELICIPIMLLHDVLVTKWRVGHVMCKAVPLLSKTLINSQCAVFLALAVARSCAELRAQRSTCSMRITLRRLICAVVPLTFYAAFCAMSVPLMLPYMVVRYGLHGDPQCFNIDAMFHPEHNLTLKIHYLVWFILLPSSATVVVCCVTKVVSCYRYKQIVYTNMDNQVAVNGVATTTTTTAAKESGYHGYVLVQLLCYVLTMALLQVLELVLAVKAVHNDAILAWIPRHSVLFDVVQGLGYSYPCFMALIVLCLHPKYRLTKRVVCRRKGAHTRNGSVQGTGDALMQDVEASFEREPDGDIIVYSSNRRRRTVEAELMLIEK